MYLRKKRFQVRADYNDALPIGELRVARYRVAKTASVMTIGRRQTTITCTSPTCAAACKAIFVGSIGNLVEWYDFYAYAAFALYFASSFFPGNDPVVQQLNAAILFAFGFIVRPIGGWLFGHLADHYGRRNALMLSVLLMCFGSLMIAVTPTYASIGVARAGAARRSRA